MQDKNIAVIGAGIIGINCALALQQSGHQVTLIDPLGVGEACSKGNAGHFATEQVFPLADASLLPQLPKFLLDPLGPMAIAPRYFLKALPWFLRFVANMTPTKRSKHIKALQALNQKAIECYQAILKQINAEHLLMMKGSLLVFESDSLEHVKKIASNYQSAGIQLEILNQNQLKAIEPQISERINYAIYFTDVGHTINPYLLCKILAEQAFKLGTALVKAKVTAINTHKLTTEVILEGGKSLKFDQLIIATGAWSRSLLNQLGYKLPLEAERGYHLDLHQSTSLQRPIVSAERKFIITPMEHGLRLAGTIEFAGLEQKANFQRAERLYDNAHFLLDNIDKPEHRSSVIHQKWAGFRPSLPDSLPVICKAPAHPSLFFALGHQHLGLTLGAVTGKLINQLVNNQTTEIDIKPYCISRFN